MQTVNDICNQIFSCASQQLTENEQSVIPFEYDLFAKQIFWSRVQKIGLVPWRNKMQLVKAVNCRNIFCLLDGKYVDQYEFVYCGTWKKIVADNS